MIPKKIDNFVMTNSKQESSFTIEANAKTFALLSDKIYSYKIAAVVREISCNAFDSMVESGKGEVPFEVTLPNYNHAYFEVEDFGLGLDEDQIENIFTVFGLSTKITNNDVIGAMGIGSKSPFAYTKTFTIRTRKNGIELVYNAYIGGDGSPKINLISKSNTDECNGLKITVPVRSEDFRNFYIESQFILSFFKTRPTIICQGDEFCFDYDESVSNIKPNEMKVAELERSNAYSRSALYSGGMYAVMGGVCYKINSYDIDEYIYKSIEAITDNGGYNNNSHVFVGFEMGSLDFVSSREHLSFDEDTKKAVEEGFEKATISFLKEYQEEIDLCESRIEVMAKFKNSFINQSTVSSKVNYLLKMFTWKGISLYDIAYKYIRLSKLNPTLLRELEQHKRQITSDRTFNLLQVALKPNLTIIYAKDGDKPTGIIGVSRELCRKSNPVIFFKKPMTELDLKRVKSIFGNETEYINIKQYRIDNKKLVPASQREKINKEEGQIISTYKELISNNGYFYRNKPATALDLDDDYLYWYDPKDEAGKYESSLFQDKSYYIVDIMRVTAFFLEDFDKIKVIPYNKRTSRHIEKKLSGRNFTDLIVKTLTDNKNEIVKILNANKDYKSSYNYSAGSIVIDKIRNIESVLQEAGVSSTKREYPDEFIIANDDDSKAVSNLSDILREYKEIANIFLSVGLDGYRKQGDWLKENIIPLFKKIKNSTLVESDMEDCKKRFPLLFSISEYIIECNTDNVYDNLVDYVKMILKNEELTIINEEV